MKVTINEYETGLCIDIQPETVEEYSKLLRFTNNAKKEPPSITVDFSASASMSVWMRKVNKGSQINSISLSRNNRHKSKE